MAHRNITPDAIGEVVELDKGVTLDDVRYGRWCSKKDGHYLLPNYLSGSDYSGTLVERSNYKKWSEDFAAGEGVWWGSTSGGHGTFGIIVDLDAIPADINDEVIEFFDGLSSYPVADDDLHSEMEVEAQNEAWESWARSDFKKALEKKFDVDLDEVDGEKLFELFRDATDRSNTYWENEQGDSMYIDLDRVVKKINEEDVKNLLG